MTSNSSSAYFNIIAPSETDVAFYVGGMSDPSNRYVGVIPQSGDLKFRVYINRAAARRGESATIRLNIAIRRAAGAVRQPEGDALVPGTPFHATGEIACTSRANGPVQRCPFGVIRQGGGSARVIITRPDKRHRTITYKRGAPSGYDASDGSKRTEFRWTRQGDQTTVWVGGERYVIPDAVVYGG